MKFETESKLMAGWIMIALVAVLLIIMVLSSAQAMDWRFGQILESDHHFDDRDYNEDHSDSFYLCLSVVCAGEYENSYSGLPDYGDDERSQFVMYHDSDIGSLGPVVFSFGAGAARYERWQPFVTVNAKISIIKAWQIGPISAWGWEVGKEDWEQFRKLLNEN